MSRLNPYYTGIHLAFLKSLQYQLKKVCLNPYYTGIHLAKIIEDLEFRGACLNPYYTGIHLADIGGRICLQLSVLILIILEYT